MTPQSDEKLPALLDNQLLQSFYLCKTLHKHMHILMCKITYVEVLINFLLVGQK